MDILSFTLGVTSILVILGVIYIITLKSSINKLTNNYKNLKQFVSQMGNDIQRNSELDNRRIDGEIDRVNKLFSESSKQITTLDLNIDRKLQSVNEKLETIQTEGCDPVNEKKKKKNKKMVL
jgi:peptidoglycan hydrolase CwlO-like protein